MQLVPVAPVLDAPLPGVACLPLQPQHGCQPIIGRVEAPALLPALDHRFWSRGVGWRQHLILRASISKLYGSWQLPRKGSFPAQDLFHAQEHPATPKPYPKGYVSTHALVLHQEQAVLAGRSQ